MTFGSAPARGDYVADESTRQEKPPEPAWVGRVQQALADGRVQLISHTGYEWPANPDQVRPATQQERDAYNAARRVFLRPWQRRADA
ncbi:hypothetical protein [Streptomyces spirodelae]|uniref:Uncharacterized protein n=1 Tax=Streptomyces spirodelae TaxID=2812904 RepID=A0ABS3WRZ1_9ACTN|nr:hypothetical protein [Streptomyces spirodelae]MBO8185888.1 hypothetical protein [Streptomyces spirodelae]